MAYVSQETKAKLSPTIKAILKKYKMKGTIAVKHHFSLVVNLQSGPIDFDHDEATAFVHDKKRNEINEFSIEYGVQDLISSFYFLRKFYPKKGVKVNESFDINMFFDNENYVFKLKHLGSETIRSKFGKIRCLKFRPFVQSGRVFEEQESVTLWVSDDKNRLPIRLQADILVGSIKADLENFKNLRHPFEILVE